LPGPTRRSLLRRLRTAPGAAALTALALVGGALWLGGPAVADDAPPPPPTTSVDAPPPDPYQPAPVATTNKASAPRHSASGTRVAPARAYSRPASAAATPYTVQRTGRASTPTHHRSVNVIRKKQRRHVVAKKPKPVTITLASVPELAAAVKVPLPPSAEHGHPYLLGAGAAFALLALAGLSLHLLCVRSLKSETAR
jgi:hypothetical protein